ncbi:hypothetical protein P152DRAFT_171738 [Eremomyces bilateralis CBS 781.70]|uniref:Uncharacterized protein n=1 Tax=Eremomyces bilateralis CBS 781.70 TaxID=1392243 RepID=A0A6G1FTY4_9PEZI|nr:uncharacterized protein P152DRAFT_171738 [Eremomyces bilateralis CBS 781.70]KAF1809168.1 hypothetical protein P152DRAFT_171738 [Eremomyces bilateralis CBS 781.70]
MEQGFASWSSNPKRGVRHILVPGRYTLRELDHSGLRFYIIDLPYLHRGNPTLWRLNWTKSLLFFGLAAIMIDEYRIQANGGLCSAIAFISLFLSRILRRRANFEAHQHCGIAVDCRFNDGFLALQTAYVIIPSLLMEYLTESKAGALRSVRVNSFTFLVFMLFTLVPLLSEQSTIAPYSNTSLRLVRGDKIAIPTRSTAWMIMLRAGFLFAMPSVRTRRPHSMPFQIAVFVLVLVRCLANIPGHEKLRRIGKEGYALDVATAHERVMKKKTIAGRFPKKFSNYAHVVLIALSWPLFLRLNFGATLMAKDPPSLPIYLDKAYEPPNDIDIVISAHNEPLEPLLSLLSDLRELPGLNKAQIHYYTKDPNASDKTIRASIGGSEVAILQNVGREGHTYLHHIVNNWDSLARHTLFMQAGIHNTREFVPRIRDYFDQEKTGFLPLGFSGNVCSCSDCGDRWGWHDDSGLIERLFFAAYGTSCKPDSTLLSTDHYGTNFSAIEGIMSDSMKRLLSTVTPVTNLIRSEPEVADQKQRQLLLTYKGQFIASAARIRGISPSVYADLLWAFEDPGSWAHSSDYLAAAGSHHEVPYLAEHPPSRSGPKSSADSDAENPEDESRALDKMDSPMLGYSLERLWGVLMRCADASPGGEAEEMSWQCPSLQSGALGRLWFGKKACQCFDV